MEPRGNSSKPGVSVDLSKPHQTSEVETVLQIKEQTKITFKQKQSLSSTELFPVGW